MTFLLCLDTISLKNAIFLININQAQIPARLAAARQVGGSAPAIGLLKHPPQPRRVELGYGLSRQGPKALATFQMRGKMNKETYAQKVVGTEENIKRFTK